MEFFSERKVKARKQHRCESCRTCIDVGEQHSSMAGKFDGYFWSARNHLDCRAAECGLAKLHGLGGGEDWIFLHDMESDDAEWVAANHPTAYSRTRRHD